MLASILSKVSPMISRAAAVQPSAMAVTREMATKTNKTAKLKAKLKASAYYEPHSTISGRFTSNILVITGQTKEETCPSFCINASCHQIW
ncbi:hypothetical protein NQZ79_g3352 [Umbelopsis isabellina]|nr:hypothetical protein NQZ79_g3352 [Umbelopsis isabellina]